MLSAEITVLGFVAGATVFLGLPVGRIRTPVVRLMATLNGIAIGILVFLVWDILSHAWAPTDTALAWHEWASAATTGVVLGIGLAAGMAGLAYYDRAVALRRARATPTSTFSSASTFSGGVLVAAGSGQRSPSAVTVGTGPSGAGPSGADLAMMISVGIGLHNFAEGLAIGSSAAAGELSLALLLVIGFALHNATEGFGIVAPLAGDPVRPSWTRLAVLGLIAGGPTLVGTLIGQRVVNDILSTAFLGLAAGSVLYVVIELLAVARRSGLKVLTTWCIVAGLALGFVTDGILIAAGA